MTENNNTGANRTEQIVDYVAEMRWSTMKRLEDKAYIAKLEDMLYRSLMRETYGWDV